MLDCFWGTSGGTVFLSVQALGGSVPLAPTLSSWASGFGFILRKERRSSGMYAVGDNSVTHVKLMGDYGQEAWRDYFMCHKSVSRNGGTL